MTLNVLVFFHAKKSRSIVFMLTELQQKLFQMKIRNIFKKKWFIKCLTFDLKKLHNEILCSTKEQNNKQI